MKSIILSVALILPACGIITVKPATAAKQDQEAAAKAYSDSQAPLIAAARERYAHPSPEALAERATRKANDDAVRAHADAWRANAENMRKANEEKVVQEKEQAVLAHEQDCASDRAARYEERKIDDPAIKKHNALVDWADAHCQSDYYENPHIVTYQDDQGYIFQRKVDGGHVILSCKGKRPKGVSPTGQVEEYVPKYDARERLCVDVDTEWGSAWKPSVSNSASVTPETPHATTETISK